VDVQTLRSDTQANVADVTANHLTVPEGPRFVRRSGSEAPREPLLQDAEELFRGIYTRAGIGFASEIVAVCSSIAGEGKTVIALGLAVTLARDFPDQRVLVVETNLERPVLAQDFDVDAAPGLVELVTNSDPLSSACRPTFLDNLDLLPAGNALAAQGRPLRSSGMIVAMESLRATYDMVILDVPGILGNSDALVVADLADVIVFVVRAGVTPLSLVNRALEQLDDTKLRGVVLNQVQSSTPDWIRRLFGA
jgi:Mrp family chromosome partitioning ATPase